MCVDIGFNFLCGAGYLVRELLGHMETILTISGTAKAPVPFHAPTSSAGDSSACF